MPLLQFRYIGILRCIKLTNDTFYNPAPCCIGFFFRDYRITVLRVGYLGNTLL
jgi:hypothetical protein